MARSTARCSATGLSGRWWNRLRSRLVLSNSGLTICDVPVPSYAAKRGGDLEQIKFLLGHSPIQITERDLGSEQEIAIAVNDDLGL